MGEKYDTLVEHLNDIASVNSAIWTLNWDMQTQMPQGGYANRSKQLKVLSRMVFEQFTDEKTQTLLEGAAAEINGDDPDSDAARLVALTRRDYEQSTKLTPEFVAEMTQLRAMGQQAWQKARAEKDFSIFQPLLEQIMDMKLKEAEMRGYEDHPYNALLAQFEPGMTTEQVKTIFDAHKPALIELVEGITANADRVDTSVMHQTFDIAAQRQFGLDMVEGFGFDFSRGRQDVAAHPFCAPLARDDVRITTRFRENSLTSLFAMMHEAGHGLHGQGVAAELDGTALGWTSMGPKSMAVAESQSRTWENMVGRSRAFWEWAYPKFQAAFPGQFDDVPLDTFYGAFNRVKPTFIRVEADEVTYNLHIMIRFELELALITGELKVADLPEAWNAKYEAYLGITPPDAAMGVLQDIHWSSGSVGYFPTYALGNLLAAQYFNAALKANPTMLEEIAEGKFDSLLNWQIEHIHRHGRKFDGNDLTRRITGTDMDPADYVTYLKEKYGAIYGL